MTWLINVENGFVYLSPCVKALSTAVINIMFEKYPFQKDISYAYSLDVYHTATALSTYQANYHFRILKETQTSTHFLMV